MTRSVTDPDYTFDELVEWARGYVLTELIAGRLKAAVFMVCSQAALWRNSRPDASVGLNLTASAPIVPVEELPEDQPSGGSIHRYCSRCHHAYRVVWELGRRFCPFCEYRDGNLSEGNLRSYCRSYISPRLAYSDTIEAMVSLWISADIQSKLAFDTMQKAMIWHHRTPTAGERANTP